MNKILEIKNLTKTYVTDSEKLTILENLDLTVEEGKKIVIVGESGCGKSTLLNIIGGIDSFTSGTVLSGKWDLSSLSQKDVSEYRSTFIGLVFQFHYLLKDFTAAENVYLPAYINGCKKKEAEEKALQLLSDVGVYERRNHLPSELSGGERQRVAVARALINNPSLILADEPTGNLDPNNSWEIMKLMEQINANGTTVLVVTHNREIVNAMKKRVITMKKGVVVDDEEEGIYIDED